MSLLNLNNIPKNIATIGTKGVSLVLKWKRVALIGPNGPKNNPAKNYEDGDCGEAA